MKCKAKKAFFAGKNDIYHRWKEVKKLNGKSMAFLTTTASALSLFSQLFMLLSRMAKLFGVFA